jgi:hypothetical protein
MIRAATLTGVILFGTLMSGAQTTQEPQSFFSEHIGLSDPQISMIARGKPVTKLLPSKTSAEIFVFGAIFVKASPEQYVKFAFDLQRLKQIPGYLGIGSFSDPPKLSDLDGFVLEPEEIRNLRLCRPGNCNVQLPMEAMEELQKELDWSSPNVAPEVDARFQKMAFELLRRYQKDGNRALGTYRDQEVPFDVAEELRLLLGRSEVLSAYLPDLNHYLLDYPNAKLDKVESLFYWERVKFGMKPTLRLNQAIAFQSTGSKGSTQVVAVKQLYASHYFQLALDLTACVAANGPTGEPGFYLISLKGSIQEGFTGFTGSFLRRIVLSKTRSAQERALIAVKRALEEQP